MPKPKPCPCGRHFWSGKRDLIFVNAPLETEQHSRHWCGRLRRQPVEGATGWTQTPAPVEFILLGKATS